MTDSPATLEIFARAERTDRGGDALDDFARYLPINVGVPNDAQTRASAVPGTTRS
jgi:hypothetical protein